MQQEILGNLRLLDQPLQELEDNSQIEKLKAALEHSEDRIACLEAENNALNVQLDKYKIIADTFKEMSNNFFECKSRLDSTLSELEKSTAVFISTYGGSIVAPLSAQVLAQGLGFHVLTLVSFEIL